ncbi:hypothetical protein Tco_0355397, partial [Tanacetum coccineum]
VASEWFKKDCIGLVTTWEDLVEKFVQKFYQLSSDNEEMEAEDNNDPDNIADILKIEGNLFNYETPFMDSFQGLTPKSPSSWHRPLALSPNFLYAIYNSRLRQSSDQSAGGKLRDLNAEESWALLEDLALYDNESWNDRFASRCPEYIRPPSNRAQNSSPTLDGSSSSLHNLPM